MEEQVKTKAKVFWYAIVINSNGTFEAVVQGPTKKELMKTLGELEKTYRDEQREMFHIVEIIKGRIVPFKLATKIEF